LPGGRQRINGPRMEQLPVTRTLGVALLLVLLGTAGAFFTGTPPSKGDC